MVEKITNQLPTVARNDEISLEEVNLYDMIMLSPGPGIPDEAGILKEVISSYAGKKPIFGICLGLQAIVEVFGGTIINMDEVYHGVATEMEVVMSDAIIFKGLQDKFQAARYHSWISSTHDFPNDLEITAKDEEGGIMAIRHRDFPISAVQFHPESILTTVGEQIIKNFIDSIKYNTKQRLK